MKATVEPFMSAMSSWGGCQILSARCFRANPSIGGMDVMTLAHRRQATTSRRWRARRRRVRSMPTRMALDLVVFVGLQGAGKSTFYRAQFAGTHELVSKDL